MKFLRTAICPAPNIEIPDPVKGGTLPHGKWSAGVMNGYWDPYLKRGMASRVTVADVLVDPFDLPAGWDSFDGFEMPSCPHVEVPVVEKARKLETFKFPDPPAVDGPDTWTPPRSWGCLHLDVIDAMRAAIEGVKPDPDARRALTSMQRLFVTAILKGATLSDAVEAAGYQASDPARRAADMMSHGKIQASFATALAE